MKSRLQWLDRALLISPYYYALCLTEKDYFHELKRLNLPREEWSSFVREGYDARVLYLERDDGKKLAIVTMGSQKGRALEEIYGLLVHEAVHIWQAIREDLREDKPASEQEAYSIQSIAQQLMQSYRAQTKKRTKK